METVVFRKVTHADIPLLQDISRKTFFDTYSSYNTEENMKHYLENNFGTKQLHSELNDPNSEFYFAERNKDIIGYFKLNYKGAYTVKDQEGVEIERIYVLKEFQRNNIGKLMMDQIHNIAKQKEMDSIWLGVWEHNKQALNFYLKIGFTIYGTHIFKLGNDDQTDNLMKIEIK